MKTRLTSAIASTTEDILCETPKQRFTPGIDDDDANATEAEVWKQAGGKYFGTVASPAYMGG